jgi:hypothetical protein
MLIGVIGAVTAIRHDIAAQEDSERRSLRGLQGIRVVIEGMGSTAERHGLTTTQVRTDVELRLRQAGIRVLTFDERDFFSGDPFLYVNIHMIFGDGPAAGLVVCNIDVELRQAVRLQRDQDIGLLGVTTWQIGSTGFMSEARLHKLRGNLGDLIDRFINDYYAANPERTPVQVQTPGPAPAPQKNKRQ